MKRYMNSMEKRIDILSWHNHGNFGGLLQVYAFRLSLNGEDIMLLLLTMINIQIIEVIQE